VAAAGQGPDGQAYVLITAARNEERYIERTIQAVARQTVRPRQWIIVSDGSTDRTERIVERYLHTCRFIRLVRRAGTGERSFASKVHAFRAGYVELDEASYCYIGNLDADVSFPAHYHERLLREFRRSPRLGIAGGLIHEECRGRFAVRPFNSPHSVAGAVQLFRRECFEAVGGYFPLKYGGIDTWAEVRARMLGWEVKSLPGLPVYHHRPTSSARGKMLRARFVKGQADFALGNHPGFEALKCLRRVTEAPYAVGGLLRLGGFLWAAARGEHRAVTPEFVRYLQGEQVARLRYLFSRSI
jgi:GT2 family glycosyltransferase